MWSVVSKIVEPAAAAALFAWGIIALLQSDHWVFLCSGFQRAKDPVEEGREEKVVVARISVMYGMELLGPSEVTTYKWYMN